MKLLYFTDVHLTNKCPVGRREGVKYLDTIIRKLCYIANYALSEQVDYVLQGGDFFDSADPSAIVVRRAIDVLDMFDKPVISLLGNHELRSVGDINESWIGILTQYNVVPLKIINTGETTTLYTKETSNNAISLTCGHYYRGIEDSLRDNPEDWSCEDDSIPRILMAHANFTPKSCIFEHITYDEFEGKQDIVLCSHYHPQGGIVIGKHGQMFVSPGALTRISRGHDDTNRVPSFAIIDTATGRVEIVSIPNVKSAEETFIMQDMKDKANREQYIDDLVAKLIMPNFKANDPLGMLEAAAAAEGVSDIVRDRSIEYLRRYI